VKTQPGFVNKAEVTQHKAKRALRTGAAGVKEAGTMEQVK
jgi:hypothetical protein